MDPNEALKLARQASKDISESNTDIRVAFHAADLMLYFDALDQWLSKGGFLPEAWDRTQRLKMQDV